MVTLKLLACLHNNLLTRSLFPPYSIEKLEFYSTHCPEEVKCGGFCLPGLIFRFVCTNLHQALGKMVREDFGRGVWNKHAMSFVVHDATQQDERSFGWLEEVPEEDRKGEGKSISWFRARFSLFPVPVRGFQIKMLPNTATLWDDAWRTGLESRNGSFVR